MPNTALPKAPPLPELRREAIKAANRQGLTPQNVIDILEMTDHIHGTALKNNDRDAYAILTGENIVTYFLESFGED